LLEWIEARPSRTWEPAQQREKIEDPGEIGRPLISIRSMSADQKPTEVARRSKLALWVLTLFAVVATGGAVVLFTLSGWSAPARARNTPNPVPRTREAIRSGMTTYRDHCESCHGIAGDGKGERAEKLNVAPADLTDGNAMAGETDGILFWKISEGHRPMPGYKSKLSETERWELVDYIRTLEKK
jgi:mono/diheme cytochrome c family protein